MCWKGCRHIKWPRLKSYCHTAGNLNWIKNWYGIQRTLTAKPWKDTKSSSLERNELLWAIKRLGRTLWKKWSGYHRRSLVETKMHCIKLLGDKLSARSFDSQVNEIHARVAVLNRLNRTGFVGDSIFWETTPVRFTDYLEQSVISGSIIPVCFKWSVNRFRWRNS